MIVHPAHRGPAHPDPRDTQLPVAEWGWARVGPGARRARQPSGAGREPAVFAGRAGWSGVVWREAPPPVGCSPVPIALVTVPAVLGERPLYSHHGRPQSSLLTQVPSTPALKGGSSPVGGQWAPSGGAAGVGILGGFRQQGGHWL